MLGVQVGGVSFFFFSGLLVLFCFCVVFIDIIELLFGS